MSMSWGYWGAQVPSNLNAICKRLGIEGKIEGVLEGTSGIRDLSQEQEQALIPYALRDDTQTFTAAKKLIYDFKYPLNELHLIDLTIKAFVYPQIWVNAGLCRAEIEDEERRMEFLLASDLIKGHKLSKSSSDILEAKGLDGLFRSRTAFAELLRSRNVEPPLKHAKDVHGEYKYNEEGKPVFTYAFAKNDIELQNLIDDPRVSDLVQTWIGLHSTIRKDRAEAFLKHTNNGTKKLPIPLKYCGAHTFRWSGADNINLQNLPSGRDGRGSKLRESLTAPDGYRLVVADSSQIEARTNAWLWQQEDLLQAFRNGEDPYSMLASEMYKVPVVKNGLNGHLRAAGKAMELGLGFGMGDDRFYQGCQSGALIGEVVPMTKSEATQAVKFWRKKRDKIKSGWDKLANILDLMCAQSLDDDPYDLGPMRFYNDKVLMPNGLHMHYDRISYQQIDKKNPDKWEIVFNSRPHSNKIVWSRIWHSKFDENLVQSLARIIVAEQALEIAKYFKIVFLVHDEVIFLARENEADQALEFGLNALRKPLSWCPDIPLEAEGGHSRIYNK